MQRTWMWPATALVALAVSMPVIAQQVQISEIRIDQQNNSVPSDNDEYFELRGPPGTFIGDLTYVVLGKRPIQNISGIPYGGAGVMVNVTKLPDDAVINANGVYLVAKSTTPMQTGITPDLVTELIFEEDTTETHLLVRNFDFSMFDESSGSPSVGFSPVGFDLDLDNDGVLDISPWEEIVDGISLVKSNSFDTSNRAYALVKVGPAYYGIPAHVFRCGNNSNWRVGSQTFRFRNVTQYTKTSVTAAPFDGTHPYNKNLTGATQAGSDVLMTITLVADMDAPDETITVKFNNIVVGSISGGFLNCASSSQVLVVPLELYNEALCGTSGNLPVKIEASASVAPCAGSSCKFTLNYSGTDTLTSDTPGSTNLFCGCSCAYPGGSVDAVFVMDTSGSMTDEGAALCADIPQIVQTLAAQGVQVFPTLWGITEHPGGVFSCLTSDVASALGPAVPDQNGNIIGQLDSPESWGDAAAVVAKKFPWTPGHARLIVTMSDEAAYQGSGPPGAECDAGDTASIANAIKVANSTGVVVSTLVGTGAVQCVINEAAALASGTSGGSASTQVPATDLADILAGFILDASNGGVCGTCKGDLNHDGVVNAADLALYNCSSNFACKDVNNDGLIGGTVDLSFVQNTHSCGPTDYCGVTPQSCFSQHANPGCNDPNCCSMVCAADPFCCTAGWDGGCVVTALQMCSPCGATNLTQSCFTNNPSPGCNDSACCTVVCSVDSSCCAAAWDDVCVFLARNLCLGCGDSQAVNCFIPNSVPFCADPACCSKVCAIDPLCCDPSSQWDVGCVALARVYCAECGASALGPCDQVQFSPSCSDKACCDKVCNIDPFCCTTMWDTLCVQRASQLCLVCGSSVAGSCCVEHFNPYCSDAACCQAVCMVDPFCCSSTWDLTCVTLTMDMCSSPTCACGTNHVTCFTQHQSPGCGDVPCCELICSNDPFCCLVRWDKICVAYATVQCSTNPLCVEGSGSCTVSHLTPGCDSPLSCCALVCATMPECCAVAWDDLCVAAALSSCQQCGNPDAGSCYASHGSPGCFDPICCQNVCQVDPFCCSISWDGSCAAAAVDICGDPINACTPYVTLNRSCYIPSPGRGCNNVACCNLVCGELDVYCCEVQWDAICALEGSSFCTPPNIPVSKGDCFTVHCCSGTGCFSPCKACSDKGCAAAVCVFDQSCCDNVWDATCVAIAVTICVDKEICPSEGSCLLSHHNPGCEDATCCNAVCANDPHCCHVEWDAACGTEARTTCKPKANWNCPCDGSCFVVKESPGCDDISCCSAVCYIDPICCIEQWDGNCATKARDLCCGQGFCGDTCAKDCLTVHAEPYCNDSWCCAAVCDHDPICCIEKWDSFCVQFAQLRCRGACGELNSGNCFAEHDNRGCSLAKCCNAICAVDPACCNEQWDNTCAEAAKANGTCKALRHKCGDSTAGSCCVAHDNPACSDKDCCTAVCAKDPHCCDTQWDDVCATAARSDPSCGKCNPACGDDCAGSCCVAHPTPKCADLGCCQAVCMGWTDSRGTVFAADSFCCDVTWDANCAQLANQYALIQLQNGTFEEGPCFHACPKPKCGSSLAGNCCEPHATPFCADEACCNTVCNGDAYCCQVQWDIQCATQALATCSNCVPPAMCGAGGSCFLIHSTPFCDDARCCNLVCAVDSACCDTAWDFNCVVEAATICFSGPEPPVNDECPNAITVFAGVTPFSNGGATPSAVPDPLVQCGAEQDFFFADVWFTFAPTVGGTWQLTTCNLANFDTVVAVYQYDGSCDTMTFLGCNNNADGCSQFTSTMTFVGHVGGNYRIRIGSPIDGSGSGYFFLRKIGP